MRQFISPRDPDKNGLVVVDGKDFHYLRNVLRIKSGDMLQMRLSDGRLLNTTVCSIFDAQRKMILQVCAKSEDENEKSGKSNTHNGQKKQGARTELYLFQFIAKVQKMELIIRQATECGVRRIIPVIGEYSQKGNVLAMNETKLLRLQKIVREAMQQSGSSTPTEVHSPMTIKEAVDFWTQEARERDGTTAQSVGIVLWERNEQTRTIKNILSPFTNPIENEQNCRKIDKAAIVVGCEGGISPGEMGILLDGGFYPVHFPTNILRCETAALYGIAALQSAIFEGKYGCTEN